jgi:putative peptidoglycan lipid II flippase
VRRTLSLGVLAGANIGLGILAQWYVVTRLGAGAQTDALFAGMALPQVILAVIGGSLVHVLVPLLAGEEGKRLHHDSWAMLVLVGGSFALLAGGLHLGAPWWVPLTVPGFDPALQALTVELTRIQLLGMVFAAVNGVQLASHHARHRFVWPELAMLACNVLGLAAIVALLPRHGVAAVAWITSVRMGVQTLMLFPGMGRPVWPDLKSPAVSLAWSRLKPLLLGTTYYKTDPLVDRFLLSAAGTGSLSLFYIAQQIHAAATEVINRAVAVPLVPRLSTMHKKRDRAGFRREYHQQLLRMAALCLAGLLLLALAGEAVLDLLLGHSRIGPADLHTLWWILVWLGGMFFGANAGKICATAFYASGDTRTPTRLSVFTYSAYVPCKVAAFYLHGVMGLALVTSLYYLVNLALQMFLLEKALSDDAPTYRFP